MSLGRRTGSAETVYRQVELLWRRVVSLALDDVDVGGEAAAVAVLDLQQLRKGLGALGMLPPVLR